MSNRPHRTGRTRAERTANSEAEKARLKAEYLTWYEQGGFQYWAAAKIGRTDDTIIKWRREDPAFDASCLEAYEKSTDNLKLTAYIRAMKGVSRGSDSLAMFFIKARDPRFRDSFGVNATHMHSGAIGTPAKVPATVQAAVDALALDLVKKMAEKL